MSTEPSVTPFLRATVLGTGLTGLLSLALVGIVPAVVAAAAMVSLVCAAATPYVFPGARQLRQLGAFVFVALAALASARVATELPDGEVADRLALAVLCLMAAQLLLGDRVRELMVALTVAGLAHLLAVGLAPQPVLVLPLALGWACALAALAVARSARLRVAADVVGEPDSPGRRMPPGMHRLPALVVVSAVLGVVIALVLPAPEGVQVQRSPFDVGSGTDGRSNAASRSSDAYLSGDLDLRSRGQLSDTPVVEVPADSPRLWRGAVLTTYTGTFWRQPRNETLDPTETMTLPGALREDTVRLRDGFGGVLLAPGTPTDLAFSGGYYTRAGSTRMSTRSDAESYAVTTRVTEESPAALRAAEGADPSQPELTSLPRSVTARVRRLATDITAGTTTRYDAVRAVEHHLRAGYTYRLDSPVPPVGTDAVDHFLFTARTGFCEQFASAEVVLLRSMGIPTRLATGFSSSGETTGDGLRRVVREREAHAWVEVWYPGLGWAPSDPTPAADGVAAGRSWWDRVVGIPNDARSRALTSGLLVGGLALWCGVAFLRRRTPRAVPPAAVGPVGPVLAAFSRLEYALARSGGPRAPSESVAELGRRLAVPVSGLRPADTLAVVERACYAAAMPDEGEVMVAVRDLDALTAEVLAASASR